MAREPEGISFATWILVVMALVLILWVMFLVVGLQEKVDELEVMVQALQEVAPPTPGAIDTRFSDSHGLVAVRSGDLSDMPNGTAVWCPDCTETTPCRGGGAGAVALRIGGIWTCSYMQGWSEGFRSEERRRKPDGK